MSSARKNEASREKDLRLAILRIKRGRSHTGAKRLNIAAVAREAGVSGALIHNHYAAIAEAIRVEQGRDGRSERNAKHQQVLDGRARSRQLLKELDELRARIARLSSINEVLLAENEAFRSRLADGKVVPLHSRGSPMKR